MNVNIATMMGLKVYRELIEKETSSPMRWAATFGVDQQLKGTDPQKLLRVDALENAISLPMPKTLQLFELQKERRRVLQDGRKWEEKCLPKFSTHPISQTSVDIWGELRAQQQRPNAEKRARPVSAPVTHSQGPPHSRGPPNQVFPTRLCSKWSVDHEYFKREAVGPAHRRAVRPSAWAA